MYARSADATAAMATTTEAIVERRTRELPAEDRGSKRHWKVLVDVKDWFLDCAKWDMKRSLRSAQALALELFGHLDVATPRRWKRSCDRSEGSAGRPKDLSDALG